MKGSSKAIGLVLGLAGASAAPGGGLPRSWTNSLGGSFQVDSNWNPRGVPGALDTAIFDLADAYTVTFAAGPSAELLNVSEGDVTFALGLFAGGLGGMIVGDTTGDVGTLTIENGTISVHVSPAIVRGYSR